MVDIIPNWQNALAKAITDPTELCQILDLNQQQFANLIDGFPQFSLRVPRSFVARMEKSNLRDPLLLQVLPSKIESDIRPGFCQDPLQEKNANPIPGLLHKYQGRVLLITTGACAVHCRYCFRREFPYEQNVMGISGLPKVIEYINNDPTIEEVILSGGDPLIFKDNVLEHFIELLTSISHLKILRIHSRLPIVLPERITETLISTLTKSRLRTVMVIHCNHPREINEEVKQSLLMMNKAGITLLNQSVLLKNINNNAEILIQLSKKLFDSNVLPYYLHLLDPVNGTSHFLVTADEGKKLLQQIRNRLPGYLVPKLVKEIAGEAAKVSIA